MIEITCPFCPLRRLNTQVCNFNVRYTKRGIYASGGDSDLNETQIHNLIILSKLAQQEKLPVGQLMVQEKEEYRWGVQHKRGVYVVCFHTKIVGGDANCPDKATVVSRV